MTMTRAPRLLPALLLLALVAGAPIVAAVEGAPRTVATEDGELECVDDPLIVLLCNLLQAILDDLAGGVPTYYVAVSWSGWTRLSCTYEPLIDTTVIIDETTLDVEVGQVRGGVQHPIATLHVPFRQPSVSGGNWCRA